MNNAKSRSYGWLVTTTLAGLSLTYVAFVFLPGQKAIAELRSELREQQVFIVQSARLTMQIKESQDKLNESTKYATQWVENSRTQRELAALYGDITKAAVESGIKLQRFDPQTVEKMNVICRLPISVACEGTFHRIYDFIARLEALPDSIWIPDLMLIKEREDSETLQAEMNLIVFADNFSNSE